MTSTAACRPPLDNGGAALTPLQKGGEKEVLSAAVKRRRAWALRDVAAMLLRPEEGRGPAVCGCGRPGHEVMEVGLHLREDGSARTSGTYRCDSPWLCTVCSIRRAKERQERVALVYDVASCFPDGQTPMITVTVRHKRGMALAEVKAAVDEAYRKVRQGAPWERA